MSKRKQTRRFTRTGCGILIVLAITLAVLAVWPAFRAARTAFHAARIVERRRDRAWLLHSFGGALYWFEDSYQRLPYPIARDDTGRPIGSWRYRLMPYLAGIMVDCDFSKSWMDVENRHLFLRWNYGYCPSGCSVAAGLHTHYVVVVGDDTPFDDVKPHRLADLDEDTILVLEVGSLDSAWMEPGDVRLEDLPPLLMDGVEGDGVQVLFADCSVWFVPRQVPVNDLKKFMTIEGARQNDRSLLLEQGAYRSY